MTVFLKACSRMARVFRFGMIGSTGLAIALQGFFFVTVAQSNPQKSTSNSKLAPAKKYRLKIQPGQVIGISLKAEKARLADITGELAKRLNTQIVLGPGLEKQLVTMEFIGLPLDVALQLLAPRVYVDYEIRSGAPPTRVGILLFAVDDPSPSSSALVTGDSQAFLVEGNTEDNPETLSRDEDEPLQAELDGDQLTVKAKKQPLVAVLVTVAEVLEVPAEIKYESTEIVDADIKKEPLEDVIPRLSPNVRLFVRADLTHSKRTPLRLRLVAPEKIGAQ